MICNELETKGCIIPSFHVDAFILKAILKAEWTSEKEFEHPNTDQKDDTINVLSKISQLTDRQCKIYDMIKNGTIIVRNCCSTGSWGVTWYKRKPKNVGEQGWLNR